MENITESKQIISEAKNIYLIPSKSPEAIAATLALFYTLKELGKNVNLIIETLPENLKFLTPSLDFVSYPKNFVLSRPIVFISITKITTRKCFFSLQILSCSLSFFLCVLLFTMNVISCFGYD